MNCQFNRVGACIIAVVFTVYYLYSIYGYYAYLDTMKENTTSLIIGCLFIILCGVSVIFQFFLLDGAIKLDAKKIARWLFFSQCTSFPYLAFVVGALAYAKQWAGLIFEASALAFLIISVVLMMCFLKKMKAAPSAPTLV